MKSDSKYMKSLNYFFPTMHASVITLCHDVVSAPAPGADSQDKSPNPTGLSTVQYKVLAGMQIQVNADYNATPYPKLLRMHGDTGNLGMEASCYRYPMKAGKMIKLVRVGRDETLGRFTYISLTPEGSPAIEFG